MRLIDADALISELVNNCNNDQTKMFPVWIEKQIDAQPTIPLLKEQEKAGTWKQIDDDTNIWSCSECDEPFILMDGTPIENKYYYCPHCGAKMGT